MDPARRPVMADVAGRAGVSVMTVSRVLNGFPGVAEDTRQRVEEAVAALGYRANPAARVLAGGRSRTLGVIAVETQQFGPSHMLYGIEAAARGAGHVLSFVTMAPGADEIGATLDHLRAAHVEGVIVIAPVRPVIDAVADLDADLPLVVVGGDPSVRTSTVTIDQEAGARMATAHLLGLGHRTVHHVSGPADWIDATERQRAWAETLEAHGAPPGRFVEGDWTAQGGYAAGTQLAQDPTVTAVFAANDQTALGILRALHEHGRSVPDEVSVVGYDDIPEAAYLVPPLTTVRQDLGEVGRRGVELLLALVDGGPAQRHVMVAPELIVRASSAPPPQT
ncbi:MAG: LacI family DNA-binding transcriptional regulator [Acidimicrobiales bacterium]